MIVGFVKAIKADKSGQCFNLLSDGAKKLSGELILASKWYPFEDYKSVFKAVCKINGNSNPTILRQFGRKAGEETMTKMYGSVVARSNAQSAMNTFRLITQGVYDSISITSETLADDGIYITVNDFDPDFEEWYLVGLGWIERTLELVIKKDVTSKIIDKSWEDVLATVFQMNW